MPFTYSVHGKEPLPTLDASEVQEVRRELVAIRDKVNVLLNAIHGNPKGTSAEVNVVDYGGKTVTAASSKASNSQHAVAKTEPVNRGGTETSG